MTTFLSSADNGAPGQVGYSAGDLIAVFDWALPTLGWTIEHTGTNKKTYRNNYTTGSGVYFQLDDTDDLDAYIRGYESMTAIDTGEYPFPTIAQSTNGGIVSKAEGVSDQDGRYWIVGDDTAFWLFIILGDYSGEPKRCGYNYFGDILSLGTDPRALLYTRATIGSTNDGNNCYLSSNAIANHYVNRGITYENASTQVGKRLYSVYSSGTGQFGGSNYLPNPMEGSNHVLHAPIMIEEPNGKPLGLLPWALAPLTDMPHTHLTIVTVDDHDYLVCESIYGQLLLLWEP